MPPKTPEEIKRLLNEKLAEYNALDHMLIDLNEKIAAVKATVATDAKYNDMHGAFTIPTGNSNGHTKSKEEKEAEEAEKAAVKNQKKAILTKFGQNLHDQIEPFFAGPKGYDDASVAEWALENYVAVRLFTSSDFIVNSPLRSLGDAEGRMHQAAAMAKLFLLKYLPEDSTLFWGSDKHVPETEENYAKFMPDNFEKLPGKREEYINSKGPLSKVMKDIRAAVKGVKKPAKPEAKVKQKPVKKTDKVLAQAEPEIKPAEPQPEIKPAEPEKVEQPESKNADPAAEAQKAVQAGIDALAEYKVEPGFKERVKELYNGELSPRDEFLFKFYEKFASNGKEAAEQTRKWMSEAYELKKAGKDNSDPLGKAADGFIFIREKSAENILKFAAENDEFMKKMCQSSQEEFLKGWARAQVIEHAYRTVFTGVSEASIKPEDAERIKSTMKSMNILNERMKALVSPAVPRREEVKQPAVNAEEPKKDELAESVPGNGGEKSLYEQDKDQLNSILQKLKNAKTTTNSDEYKTIISSLKNLNSKEDIPAENGQKLDPAQTHAAKLFSLKVAVNNYLKHKSCDGVKKNTYHKLAAVEELNQFITQRMNGLDFAPFRYSDNDIKPHVDQDYVTAHDYAADDINKGVAAANKAGIRTDAAEAIRVQDCMQKIIGMATVEKNKSTLSSMKNEFLKYPAPVDAPKLSATEVQDAVQKANKKISPKSDSDSRAISSAYEASNEEFDEEKKFLFSYAERNGLKGEGTRHNKLKGKSLTSVILGEASRVNKYHQKQLKDGYSNGSHRASEVQMDDSFFAFCEIESVVKADLKSNIDINAQLSRQKLSDAKLISNWPSITEKLAGYELILGKGGGEKCSEIIDNYNNMKARMNKIAERSAGQVAKSQKQQVL